MQKEKLSRKREREKETNLIINILFCFFWLERKERVCKKVFSGVQLRVDSVSKRFIDVQATCDNSRLRITDLKPRRNANTTWQTKAEKNQAEMFRSQKGQSCRLSASSRVWFSKSCHSCLGQIIFPSGFLHLLLCFDDHHNGSRFSKETKNSLIWLTVDKISNFDRTLLRYRGFTSLLCS